MKKLYLVPVGETNNGRLEDAPIFRGRRRDSRGRREKRNKEVAGRRKQAGTGRSLGPGSGKGRGGMGHVFGKSRGQGGSCFAGLKVLCACAVPGARIGPGAGAGWLRGRRSCSRSSSVFSVQTGGGSLHLWCGPLLFQQRLVHCLALAVCVALHRGPRLCSRPP